MEYKVVNTAYPEDGEIGVQQMSVTYVQGPNTDDDQDHYQYLKFTTMDVPHSSEEYNPETPMYYFNIEIPNFDDGTPGHWSICESEELVEIFNDFKSRLVNNKKKENGQTRKKQM